MRLYTSVALSAAFLFPLIAQASTFSVRVDTPFATGGPYAVTDVGPDEAEAENRLVGNHIWEAYAYAGYGVLRGSSDAWSNGDFFRHTGEATSSSRMSLDDLVFSSPSNDPISVTLNLSLTGEFWRSGTDRDDELTVNEVSVFVEYGGGAIDGEYRVVESFGSGLTETGSGLLSGLSGDLINETIQVTRTVPVNTPVGLNLELHTRSRADKWTCRAITNFSDSFHFQAGSGVFDVPAGVSVNSPSGNIVDNQFVPEPSALALGAAGLLMLWGLGRLKRATRGRSLETASSQSANCARGA